MKKTALILSKISYFVASIILLYLSLQSARLTFLSDVSNLVDESIRKGKDIFILNILVAILGAAVLYALSKAIFKEDKQKNRKRLSVIQIAVSCFIFVLLILFVLKTKISPYWDQMEVFLNAQRFNAGDYEDMNNMYLKMYPQQYGLIFFEGILIRIVNHYRFMQCLNALFISLSVFFAGRTVMLVSDNEKASFFATVLMAVNFPFFYYVSFVYGDVFFAFSAILIAYLSINFCKKKKPGFIVGALATACVALPVRQNALIFLITIVIFFLLYALKEKKLIYILIAILFMALPILTDAGIKKYYEHKSGYEVSHEEIPKISWVVMGLQGDPYEGKGVGYYNGYNYGSYLLYESKKELAAAHSRDELSMRLSEFKQNKKLAVDFFNYKALEQWSDPLFESAHMTAGDGSEYDKIRLFYNSKVLGILRFLLNYYQFFIYVFALIFSAKGAFGKTDAESERFTKNLYSSIFTIMFTGGFLFSLIWEAKGRYVFPFFVVLIPIAAAGLKITLDFVTERIKKVKGESKA